ncbi:unnamed protein product [Calypogeia fissa]
MGSIATMAWGWTSMSHLKGLCVVARVRALMRLGSPCTPWLVSPIHLVVVVVVCMAGQVGHGPTSTVGANGGQTPDNGKRARSTTHTRFAQFLPSPFVDSAVPP